MGMGTERFYFSFRIFAYVFSGKFIYKGYFFFLTNNLKHSHQSVLEKSLQLPESIQQEVVAFPHREQFALGPWKEWGEGERGNVSPSNSFRLNSGFIGWAGLLRRPKLPSLTPEFKQFEIFTNVWWKRKTYNNTGVLRELPGASILVSKQTRGKETPSLSSSPSLGDSTHSPEHRVLPQYWSRELWGTLLPGFPWVGLVFAHCLSGLNVEWEITAGYGEDENRIPTICQNEERWTYKWSVLEMLFFHDP